MKRKLRLVLMYNGIPLAATNDPSAIQTAADACLAESIARVGKLSDPILAAVEKSETTRMKELFHDLGLAGAGGRVM